MKNTGGESLPAEGRNYAGTSINNENPAPPSTHREKVTLLRGSLNFIRPRAELLFRHWGESPTRHYIRQQTAVVGLLGSFAGFKVSLFHATTILVLVTFEVLTGCYCGIAKRRPMFPSRKRGSDLLWRLGKVERRYERARGCRGSPSLNLLIVVRREV